MVWPLQRDWLWTGSQETSTGWKVIWIRSRWPSWMVLCVQRCLLERWSIRVQLRLIQEMGKTCHNLTVLLFFSDLNDRIRLLQVMSFFLPQYSVLDRLGRQLPQDRGCIYEWGGPSHHPQRDWEWWLAQRSHCGLPRAAYPVD